MISNCIYFPVQNGNWCGSALRSPSGQRKRCQNAVHPITRGISIIIIVVGSRYIYFTTRNEDWFGIVGSFDNWAIRNFKFRGWSIDPITSSCPTVRIKITTGNIGFAAGNRHSLRVSITTSCRRRELRLSIVYQRIYKRVIIVVSIPPCQICWIWNPAVVGQLEIYHLFLSFIQRG